MKKQALKQLLPPHGITLKELSGFEISGTPVSASKVRALIDSKNIEAVKALVPDTTYNFLLHKGFI